jgi:hypothetical protein
VSIARKLKGPQDLVIVPAGRYKALKKLAETSSSEIFLAEHVGVSGLRRLHALKRLRPSLSAEAAFRVSLSETVRESMALHHGGLVGLLDFGEASGRPFIVMELVEGWSLDQLMWRARTAQHPLPWPLAAHLACEAARALAFLHRPSHGPLREGIVHGDISPTSVLLSEHGELKLGDWSVAHARARQSGDAVTAAKAAFASPELALGEAADARSDVFSLGALLYWLLADVPAFKGNGEREVLARVEAVDLVPLTGVRPGLPKELNKVVTGAMQRDPKHRFQSASDMRAALEVACGRERCGRSELEGWLASLARRDGRGPAAGEVRPNVAVPLRTLKSEAPRAPAMTAAPALNALPVPLRSKTRLLLAAAALVALGFGAERLWRRGTSRVAIPDVPARPMLPTAPAPATAPPPPASPGVAPGATERPKPPPPPSPALTVAEKDVDVTLEDTVVQPDSEGAALLLNTNVEQVVDDRAFVHLQSIPPGASITLDDRVLGTTPVTLRFKMGVPFALRFHREGYADVTRWLTVQEREEGLMPQAALELPPTASQ